MKKVYDSMPSTKREYNNKDNKTNFSIRKSHISEKLDLKN